ncbi:MAG: hypothetical protein LBT18_04245 [Endomicrobium sp.]|jgi:3-deoxy-D-manno-octulosonic-acid transferase|nr:hypothetical protein [Endomicrobium sp.]
MIKFFLILYNVLFALSLPFIVFIVLFSSKYRKELFYKLHERFAIYNSLSKNTKKTLWIHCASLGEVRAVDPILDELKDKYFIVLTSITKSGREYAQKLQKADFVALLPLDIYPVMCKAFDIIKPDMLILVETELWATMLYTAAYKNVKIITINGRMSAKSFRTYKKLKFFWNKFTRLINVVIARNKDDAARFIFLTDGKSKVIVSGNIKYDRKFMLTLKREEFFLNKEDFVFTAGSTREGEEEIIADVYNKISCGYSNVKFFLAPRHISRISNIIKILEDKHIKYSLFSSCDFKNKFVLVDIFGKLQSIYSVSDICYVGGSIVKKGGQNPIEPASYGKPVLFGKNMDNFKTESEILVKYGGALIVEDVNDLTEKLENFINDKVFLKDVGQNALKVVASQKGALAFTIEKIKESLDA